MAAYYNEIDRFAAAWLRELIKAGLIADGEVDERDIRDVEVADVRGFTQCHFFAGIGGWSYALRLAGWPDDRPVWTGSCPCQPFSSAGKGEGGADDRHLWPHWARLIRECQPVTVFGEQVESAIAHGWIDAVFDDLEREGYACGAACLPAASVGAFHRRQRLWFVAESNDQSLQSRYGGRCREGMATARDGRDELRRGGTSGELAESHGRNTEHRALQRRREHGLRTEDRHTDGTARITERTEGELGHAGDGGESSGVVNPSSGRRQQCHTGERAVSEPHEASEISAGDSARDGREGRRLEEHTNIESPQGMQPERPSTRGFWDGAEWIACRDGRSRPIEPGTFPLAHGLPARVGRLRGYGNAIVPACAAAFIQAYCEAR